MGRAIFLHTNSSFCRVMGLCHGSCMQTVPGSFLNLKELQIVTKIVRAMLARGLETHGSPRGPRQEQLSPLAMPCGHSHHRPHSLRHPPPKPTRYRPRQETRGDGEPRTTGLTRDHANIPAVVAKSPGGSGSGGACAAALKNQGSLDERGFTRVKSGLPNIPSQQHPLSITCFITKHDVVCIRTQILTFHVAILQMQIHVLRSCRAEQ